MLCTEHVGAEETVLRACASANLPAGQLARIGEVNAIDATRGSLIEPGNQVADIKDDLPPHFSAIAQDIKQKVRMFVHYLAISEPRLRLCAAYPLRKEDKLCVNVA